MSIFMERYVSWLFAAIGGVAGTLVYKDGGGFWLSVFPISLSSLLWGELVQVVWRILMVLEANRLGYKVTRDGPYWIVSETEADSFTAHSLSSALDWVRSSVTEKRIREDERARIEAQAIREKAERERQETALMSDSNL